MARRGHLQRPARKRGEPAVRLIDLKEGLEADWTIKQRRKGSFNSLKARFRAIIGYFGRDKDAGELDFLTLQKYAQDRLEKASRATVKLELALLSAAMGVFERAGKLRRPPFPSITVRNARQGFFDEKAFLAIKEQLSWDLRPVVEFLWHTGWRVSEVISLKWADVDWKEGVIRLPGERSKNHEARSFPFASFPPLRSLMERQRSATDVIERRIERVVPTVFWRDSNARTQSVDGAPIRSFAHAWRGARKRAGYPAALIHDFRRTVVRRMSRAKIRPNARMRLVGMKSLSIEHRYDITDDSDLKEELTKLDEFVQGDAGACKDA